MKETQMCGEGMIYHEVDVKNYRELGGEEKRRRVGSEQGGW